MVTIDAMGCQKDIAAGIGAASCCQALFLVSDRPRRPEACVRMENDMQRIVGVGEMGNPSLQGSSTLIWAGRGSRSLASSRCSLREG